MFNSNPFSAATGAGNENLSSSNGQKVPANFWAIIAFLSAIAGFVVFYKKAKQEAILGALLGALGFVSLFILRLVIKSKVESQTGGMFHIETDFLFGYWASLLAFIVAGGISYLRFRQEKNTKPELEEKTPGVQTPTPIHVNIITQDNDANS